MSESLYTVYGASGCGREIMPLARDQLLLQGGDLERLLFVDDQPGTDFLNGQKVVNYDELLRIDATERYVSVAIADSIIRENLVSRCEADGIKLWSVIASNVIMMDLVQLGEGAILSPFVTVTSNVQIGKAFHANMYSYVAHDCVIGDFVTFAPGVKCNGNVVIEDHAYIGTGVVIKQGKPGFPLTIGKGAVVGMGAVVTKNVPAGVTVFGNPARIYKDNL